jgi:hypothetical protein
LNDCRDCNSHRKRKRSLYNGVAGRFNGSSRPIPIRDRGVVPSIGSSMTVISTRRDSSGTLRLSRHNQLPRPMLKVMRGSGGNVRLPIPPKDGGLTDDAQLDHDCTGSHDQAARRALYLDESKHRRDVSLPAGLPGFVQEDLAGPDVGRRGWYTATARVGRCGNFVGQSVLLLNVRASALPAGCRIRVR